MAREQRIAEKIFGDTYMNCKLEVVDSKSEREKITGFEKLTVSQNVFEEILYLDSIGEFDQSKMFGYVKDCIDEEAAELKRKLDSYAKSDAILSKTLRKWLRALAMVQETLDNNRKLDNIYCTRPRNMYYVK